MSGYRFSPRAREDLREIHDYVAKDGLRIAARLIDRLEEACELLVRFPELGERREDLAPSVRCFSVGNYAIFYRLTGEGVEIVRVVSGARNFEALFGPEP